MEENMMTKVKSRNMRLFSNLLHVIGLLLMMESLFMFICSIASLVNYQYYATKIMLISCLITFVVGFLSWLPFRKKDVVVDKREGFLIVTLIWIIFSFFGALPSYLGGYIPRYVDAYFETMSGFTTMGATIMNDVEHLPYSVGLWRIMTQWIGGVGIIVIMLSIIPFVGGGGMALYSAEVAGPTKSKIAPHIKQTASILMIVYLILTIIYFVTYCVLGMNVFDAICHSFTTVATGGLSSKNLSAMAFSPTIQYVMAVFMILSGTNLLLVYCMFKGKWSELRNSEELKVYILVLIVATVLVFFLTYNPSVDIEQTFRHSIFMVSSILTSTGMVNCDISLWPISAVIILFMLMISGAMSGSTTGGLKIVRMMILFKNARNTISKGLHSNAFIPITINKKMVSDETLFNVFQMFMLYILSLVAGTLIFVACGIPIEESIISASSALGSMGPAYGDSSLGNFAHFNDVAKITMSFLMCAGRLELITVYSIFTVSFWKK